MKKLLLILFSIYFFGSLSAQEKKGDKLYDNLGYLSATEEYQNLDESQMTYEVKLKLANSFRLNSQYEAAEYWLAQIIQEAQENETILHYAQMLQSNGKCEDAIRWFKVYQERSGDTQRSFIEDCKDLDKFEKHANIKVTAASSLNSDKHDFSPIPYNNGLIFTSMRESSKGHNSKTDLWTNSNYSDLYFVVKKEEGFGEPTLLKGDINGTFHDGVATFDPIQQQLIFTRNTPKGKGEDGVKHLNIYHIKQEGDTWKNPEELSFCSQEYSTCHPTISADGQRLYFASDQPGGFGGMDIYVSPRAGNKWGTPTNLGPIVNSSGNEIFPFISQRDKLFFASDGHKGMGGLDIFVVEKTKDTDEASWGDRKNIGKPFNTKKDDFGFYIDADEETGYLSSNRIGSTGADDIYAWEKTDKENDKKPFDPNPNKENNLIGADVLTLNVCDAATKKPISKAKVAVLKVADNWLAYEDNEQLPNGLIAATSNGDYSIKIAGGHLRADASLLTDQEGAFKYFYHPQQTYSIFAEKAYYAPQQKQLTGLELSQSEDKCIYLQRRDCIQFKGTVKNKHFQKNISGASITILDKCKGEIYNLISDQNGQFELCLDCKCDYLVTAQKANFKDSILPVSTINTPCTKGIVLKETIELELDILQGNDQLTADYLNQYFTGDARTNYKVGQVLTLKNIYYDFDKSNIRADAAYELDYLAALLNQNPTMEIELSSHTDSRGKTDYNRWLSRDRAKSVKKYLIAKGISTSRIHKSVGLGETQLTNGCADGVKCSEVEHQMNRRTEVRIVGYKQPESNTIMDDSE